ncbi:DUF4328 domain-containing protein [Streptomyces sp. A0642]|uniref:DUF4328 domain-containing protein n=1 Tax=Streptomyces sp. A0642 TaxID=2563100 RepID=UPI0010A238AA|nr:DUF4328 domain-containing protein [Streptomyces sp. A0642]THA75002.1 DUF4328 domain-containing protein [Streptomyces sp. A0642]
MPTPAGPAPLSSLRSPVGIGKAVCVLLGAVAVADVASIAAGGYARQVYDTAMAGDFLMFDDARADRADALYQASGSLRMLLFLATVVVFLVWFRRVRLNAEVFDAYAHTLRPGWAIGGWFVPLGNLWLPHRVASGVWTASSPGGSHRPPAPSGLLHAWWAALLCSEFLSRLQGRLYPDAVERDAVLRSFDVGMVADMIDIAAAVLAVLFVRRLTAMQSERAAERASTVPPLPVERADWGRSH